MDNKACFLSLVEQVKSDHKMYAIDQLAKSKGVTVLRLPKYHNELNPFEFAWPIVKEYVVNNMTESLLNLNSAKYIVMNGLNEVTRDNWKEYIEQVKSAELDMHELDQNIDSITDSYLKFVGNPRYPGDEISSGPSESEAEVVA